MIGDNSNVKVRITGEDQASQVFDAAASKAERYKARVEKAWNSLATVAKGLAATAVAAAAGAGAAFLRSAADSYELGDSIGKLSQRTGIATETLSVLAYQADLAGSSLQSVATGFKFLAQNLAEAQSGSREAGDVFRELGVDFESVGRSGEDLENLFATIADRIAEMPDGVDKSNAAIKLFGKAGGELIPLLNEGADGFATARKEATAFGLVFTPEAARRMAAFNDQLERTGKSAKGYVLSAMNAVLSFYGGNIDAALSAYQTFMEIGSIANNQIANKDGSKGVYTADVAESIWLGFKSVEDYKEFKKRQEDAGKSGGPIPFSNADQFYIARSTEAAFAAQARAAAERDLNDALIANDAALHNAAIATGLEYAELAKLLELEKRSDFGAGIRAGLDETRAELSDFFAQAHGMTIEFLRGTNQDWKTLYFDTMQGRVEGLGQFFGRFFNSMIVQIQQIAAQQAANATTSLLLSGLSGIFGGGAAASASGNQTTALINPGAFGSNFEPPAEARATGGPVVAGRSYLVGEKRAELFTPREDGMIHPSAGGKGTSVAINIYAVDAASFMQLAGQNADGLFQVVVSVAGKDPNARNALRGVIS